MGRNKIRNYYDGLTHFDGTVEELEDEIKRLEEESKNLTEWDQI